MAMAQKSRSEPESAVPELHLLKDFTSLMPLELLDIHSAEELAELIDVKSALSFRKKEADHFVAFATRAHHFVGLLPIQCIKMARQVKVSQFHMLLRAS